MSARDLTLASTDDDGRWTSLRSDKPSLTGGSLWMVVQSPTDVVLADKQIPAWNNRLVDPFTFLYELPIHERCNEYERRGLAMLTSTGNAARGVVVHLYTTNQAQDQYLGQFVATAPSRRRTRGGASPSSGSGCRPPSPAPSARRRRSGAGPKPTTPTI